MKTIAAGEFKARCLALMEDVRSTRQPIVITKRGKPVAKIAPLSSGTADNRRLFGALKGVLTVEGDILSTGDRWNAES